MLPARRVLKICFCGVATLSAVSLHENNYDLDSLAPVRVWRSAITVLFSKKSNTFVCILLFPNVIFMT